MRIIAGKFKSFGLITAEGKTTRPTSDFNREVIFSMYQDFTDKKVLDLFAGSGSFGFEALSRGAIFVDFVEFASLAIGVILKNSKKLHCQELCHIHRCLAEKYLRTATLDHDIIFMDPPYDKNLINPCLRLIYDNPTLNQEAIIIIEHSPREKIDPAFQTRILRQKSGKNTAFSILSATEQTPESVNTMA